MRPRTQQLKADEHMATADTSDHLAEIKHVVVLMLENRSFDHVLGYLSLEGGRADINGPPCT
jgi:phospholipase C